jgi:hypothetical protein
MDINTIIFDQLNDEQKILFEKFQTIWMKKFDYKTITFGHYFHYVHILIIKNSQKNKLRKHNVLHVEVMEFIKNLCSNVDSYIFQENIKQIDAILKEKFMEINININIKIHYVDSNGIIQKI